MKRPFEVLSTQGLSEMTPPEWLLEEFFAEKSTTLIYGPWGLGKSFMMLDAVLTASTGETWFGDRAVKRPLRTLYVVAEGAAWWYRRIQAYEIERGPVDYNNVRWIPEPVDLTSQDHMTQLEEVLADFKPDLLVFDTWVRCTAAFGMDENSATETAQVIARLDRLRDIYDVTPVIIHHPAKGGTSRGSGNLMASVERVIRLEEIKGDKFRFMVHDEKGNHLEPFGNFQLGFEPVHIDADHSSAVLRYEGKANEKVGGSSNNVSKVLHTLVNNDMVEFTAADVRALDVIPEGSVSYVLDTMVKQGTLVKEARNKYVREVL